MARALQTMGTQVIAMVVINGPRVARPGLKRPQKISQKVADRWTPRIAGAGFTPVASAFLVAYAAADFLPDQKPLNSTDAMLLVQIMSFKWGQEAPYPSLRVLSERMGLDERTVRGVIQGLKERGLVARYKVPGRRSQSFDMKGLFAALEAWMAKHGVAKDAAETAPAAAKPHTVRYVLKPQPAQPTAARKQAHQSALRDLPAKADT